MTPLCDLALKYRTDKCPQIRNSYTPFYYGLFRDRRKEIKKVLEMGIGFPSYMNKVSNYITGASLYMWRDFFPNAKIYGADISPEAMFKEERIKTFLCDEMNKKDLKKLVAKTGSDIDIFIDDGTHFVHQQLFLCQNMMPLLQKSVIYIIEDIVSTRWLASQLREYDCFIPDIGNKRYRGNLMVVRNK